MKKMCQKQNGSVILCAVLTLAIISIIAAGVLFNCTTRYNVSSKQVKAWNEALYTAEAAGDIAFAELRKMVSNGSTFSTAFQADGWTPSGSTYSKSVTFGQDTSQSATVTVDAFTTTNTFNCYRIRSVGTARIGPSGASTIFRHVGMDDKLMGQADTATHFANGSSTRGSGDTLLRKIDMNYDHFLATYGDGDGNSKTLQTVANPQVTRRIETIAVPQWASTGALKVTGSFDGPGSAGIVDSYDSKNGAYSFVANNPASPLYQYSQNGDISVATSSYSEGGPIYGDVTTNGGNVTHSGTNISGTIDNNVPFAIPPLLKPSYPSGYVSSGSSNATITPSQAMPNISPGGVANGVPNFYVYTGDSDSLTINAYTSGGKTYETHVTVIVNGNAGDIEIGQGVIAQIYFTGDLQIKARGIINNNVDGTWSGVYQSDGVTTSTQVSRAGALQLYGISPTDGSYQNIDIGPPGSLWAALYAPNGNVTMTGNPQWYGAIVAHNFSGNGSTSFHYDMEIIQNGGIPIDYQLASYVEDIR
jgi:hypothetical protein